MKCRLIFFFSLLPVTFFAQVNGNGIQWVKNLSWEQVVANAKSENKHIFIDFFATWCGPCKKMDQQVYQDDELGRLFNDKFISLKVQLDKTNKDPVTVQQWYKVAEQLQKKYRVIAFPTFVFLDPNGEITHKISGYKSVSNLIREAKTALELGRIYEDPDKEYYALLDDYNAGDKDYTKMPYLVQKALKLRQRDVAKQVAQELKDYLGGLDKMELYSKAYLEFIATAIQPSSKSPFFSLFYGNEKKVNRITGIKYYAQKTVVDNAIQTEIVTPSLKFWYVDNTGKDSRDIHLGDKWAHLFKEVHNKYNRSYASRNLLIAKIKWYDLLRDYPAYVTNYLDYLDKYGPDTWDSQSQFSDLWVNYNLWNIFLKIADQRQLSVAAKWAKVIMDRNPQSPMYMDTYANLLHKTGKTEDALKWEQKAFELAEKRQLDDAKEYAQIIERMKRNEPTWPVVK